MVLVIGVAIATLLYFPMNHAFARQYTLTVGLDSDLPLIPAFAVPYLLFLPLFWATVLYSLVTDRGFTQLALAIIIAYLVSDAIYLVFHTYMPRPEHVSGSFSGLVHFVYSHDHPYNDFPSEHASSATLLALFAWRYARRWGWAALVFAVLVVLGTMFIRQHSVAGALSGVCLGAAAWVLAAPLAARLFGFEPGVQEQSLHYDR